MSVQPPGSQNISFPTEYSANFLNQCMANAFKQFRSYWKYPPYNAMRYLMTVLYAVVFGTVFWGKGKNVYGSTLYSNFSSNSIHLSVLTAINLCNDVRPAMLMHLFLSSDLPSAGSPSRICTVYLEPSMLLFSSLELLLCSQFSQLCLPRGQFSTVKRQQGCTLPCLMRLHR